jgi:hypothetical protein
MPIPKNITRNHIVKAIKRIDEETSRNILPKNRLSRKYFLRYQNFDYPVKLVISYANVYPNGKELDPNPREFTTYMAQDYIIKMEDAEFKLIATSTAKRNLKP